MSKRIVLVLALGALVAFAGTVPKVSVYQLTLVKPAVVSGTTLKAGDYKLTIHDATVTLTSKEGGASVQAPVKIQTSAEKFDATAVTYQSTNGSAVVSEIDLGGSKIALLFAQ